MESLSNAIGTVVASFGQSRGLFLWPMVGKRFPLFKLLPSPLIVLLVAIPMGMAFDLMHTHSFTLQNHQYQLGENYLVAMPDRVFGMFDSLTYPEFSAQQQLKARKWVLMFFIIGLANLVPFRPGIVTIPLSFLTLVFVSLMTSNRQVCEEPSSRA